MCNNWVYYKNCFACQVNTMCNTCLVIVDTTDGFCWSKGEHIFDECSTVGCLAFGVLAVAESFIFGPWLLKQK